MTNPTLPSHIEKFADCFDLLQRHSAVRCGLEKEALDHLTERPLDAMIFWTLYAHERAGRNPKFQFFHRAALYKSLGHEKYETGLNQPYAQELLKEDFAERVWGNFCSMTNGKTNEKLTRGPVRDTLEKLRKESSPNLVARLLNLGMPDARKWLLPLKGVGPKIASFFLRDCFSFSHEPIPSEQQWLAQPVDRWVLFWADKAWPTEKLPEIRKHDDQAKRITESCQEMGVNPIAFNKGAWFLGAHYSDIRLLYGLPESAEVLSDYATNVLKFGPEKIIAAMDAFRRALRESDMLPF
ncbi:MAG: HhH-GDP family DNA glycosylase [Candidatus Acidiferrales bacterium]